jgi:uncharacterized membrane protein YhiD involved in acid resistance
LLAVATTIIVLVSLWPLRRLSERLELAAPRRLHVRVQLAEAGRLTELFDWLDERKVEIVHFDSERDPDNRHTLDLTLRLPTGVDRSRITSELGALDWVTLGEVSPHTE